MAKKFLILTLVAIGILGYEVVGAEKYKNYEIEINGKTYGINLEETVQAKDKAGEPITIKLHKKAYAEYSDKFLSFQHDSKLNVASQDLGSGIQQLMLANATGSLVIVQEYSGMDPSSMVGMMLRELTKESINYGYKMTKTKLAKKLKSGKVMNGLQATLTYRENVTYWIVVAYGKKDDGILVATHVDKEFIDKGKKLLDHFWETLEINL